MADLRRFVTFKGDKVIWYMIIMLMIASVLVIYSSTGRLAYKEQEGNVLYYLIKQLFLLGGCFVIMFFLQSVNYKYFSKYAGWLLVISVGLLLYAALAGANINGAGRWIRIPLIGLTFQPSELAKLAIVMYTARIITFAQTERHCENYAFSKFLIYVGPVILVIFMDSFSTSMLISAVCYILFIVGRLRWALLGKIAGGVVVAAGVMIVLLLYVPQVEKVGRLATVKSRVTDFIQGGKDTDGYSAQSVYSKIAVARGGLLGNGPGNSVQRNFLPHPYSDFIYAIIIEEYGLIGGGFIMLCYLIILFRIGVIVRQCTRIYPALLVTGLGLTIVMQAMINMGVCVGLFPVTGQTLPLISMGGTSLWFTSAAFGMILSVSHSFSEEGEEALRREENETDEDSDEEPCEDDEADETDIEEELEAKGREVLRKMKN